MHLNLLKTILIHFSYLHYLYFPIYLIHYWYYYLNALEYLYVLNRKKGGNKKSRHLPKKNHGLKKTIHKKYTLGKSNIKRTVAVLLKDNTTRKNIINAQKDLKAKSVNDVKTYLRHHNLIKIGSNAPNDVIRKIYESAMLAGEITNNNKDIMFHNFIKEDN